MLEKLLVFVQSSLVAVAVTGLLLGSATGLFSTVGVGQVVEAHPTTIMADDSNFYNPFFEFGTCVVDYTESLTDDIEAIVDTFSHLIFGYKLEHHDVYRKVFENFEASQREEQLGSTVYRGFYATGNDLIQWTVSLVLWFTSRSVHYVNGHMIDKQARDSCSMFTAGYLTLDGGRTFTLAGKADQRWGVPWSQFHLFKRNCQTWADYVRTGN